MPCPRFCMNAIAGRRSNNIYYGFQNQARRAASHSSRALASRSTPTRSQNAPWPIASIDVLGPHWTKWHWGQRGTTSRSLRAMRLNRSEETWWIVLGPARPHAMQSISPMRLKCSCSAFARRGFDFRLMPAPRLSGVLAFNGDLRLSGLRFTGRLSSAASGGLCHRRLAAAPPAIARRRIH